MGSDTYHEPFELLSDRTRNLHRGITTLIEELEAVDWYQQRADVCTDEELRRVLVHNRNEEIEHAMMSLEWIRRSFPEFDDHIRTYLLRPGPITEIERASKAREVGANEAPRTSAMPIGSLKANAAAQATPERGSEE